MQDTKLSEFREILIKKINSEYDFIQMKISLEEAVKFMKENWIQNDICEICFSNLEGHKPFCVHSKHYEKI